MKQYFPAVVVPVYNKLKSCARLFESLKQVKCEEPITLIISIEGGADLKVKKLADDFDHPYYTKKVINNKSKLGLRDHILRCGDLTYEYGSIILLEDDLIVGNDYYNYSRLALNYYSCKKKIAGISLYSYEKNELCDYPFVPMRSGYDTFLMQFPSSWGQCWNVDQWHSFKEYYKKIPNSYKLNNKVPEAVKNWPSSSWKKYFLDYLVTTNKFFVYPYLSKTTNCSDPGGHHIRKGTNKHQVSFTTMVKCHRDYFFCSEDSEICYDSYMEPIHKEIPTWVGMVGKRICFDYYGLKPVEVLKEFDYVLTTKHVKNYVKRYPLSFKPMEINLLYSVDTKYSAHISLVKGSEILVKNSFSTFLETYRTGCERLLSIKYLVQLLIFRILNR